MRQQVNQPESRTRLRFFPLILPPKSVIRAFMKPSDLPPVKLTPADRELIEEFAAHPHDAFVKRAFLDTDLARAFFLWHLPRETATTIEWSTLKLEPASFIKTDLKENHADLLFSVQRNQRAVLLYLLFEHQSTVDESMRLRLHLYQGFIWQRYRQQHPEGPLPVIIAYVLNQGPEAWTISTRFEEQFEIDESDHLYSYVPKYRHELKDLSKSEPRKENAHEKLQITLSLLQQARRKDDLLDFFLWLDLNHPLVPIEDFRLMLLYAMHVERSLDARKLLRQNLKSRNLKGATVTTAELLRAEGRSEGRSEGRLIGSIAMLERVLHLPATPVANLEVLSLAELEEILDRLETQYDQMEQDR